MQNTTDTANRWELVSSLYGPGTFYSWLCIVASVAISWGINPITKRSDSITNDLIAALTLPVVGAADALYQLTKYARSGRTTILFSPEPEDLQLVAALEAPLAICEVYIILSLFLHSTVVRKYQWKRMSCVILTMLLCFAPELVIFFTYPGLNLAMSTFARPFLFHFVMALGFASAVLIINTGISIIRTMIVMIYRKLSSSRHMNHGHSEIRYTNLEKWSNVVTSISIALEIATVKSGYISNTAYYARPGIEFHTRILRFTPKSNIPITDLDQLVALAGGVITLFFNIYDVVKVCRLRFRNNGGSNS
ncbi:hypothetical protein F53441_1541 [Fusarium austroafricanum]|uniref:Uncharacterized protein n=1 Tax=Fusarium austroafricanum TaxID=2364996 RepID=A0A8H4KUB3_9HYPO|nr:hypothetical protein F53441_1541 [Fusarium austroafricanum]